MRGLEAGDLVDGLAAPGITRAVLTRDGAVGGEGPPGRLGMAMLAFLSVGAGSVSWSFPGPPLAAHPAGSYPPKIRRANVLGRSV